MVLLELFSGIGGFAKGFEQAGYKFTKHYFSEIDKHAIENYKFNFPNAESLGSVTDVSGGDIERPDIITFGFPCQDLSIAGLRKGFTGLVEPRKKFGNQQIYEDTAPTVQAHYGTGGDNISYVVQMNDSKESGGQQPYMQNRVYDPKGISPAITEVSNRLNIVIPDAELMLRDSRDNRSTLKSGRTTELGVKNKSIRRLTEIECERLQGFPDNWTQFGNYDGEVKKIAKSQRYKLLGNAVTVNIVELIARRLLK